MFFSDDMRELVQLFQKHEVQFAVCGGFAVAHYGFIRATMDFDLLILPDEQNAKKVIAALVEFGFGGVPLQEESFIKRGTAITLGAQPNQIDLLTSMSSQSTKDIIAGATTVEIQGIPMNIVSLDDLLTAKKEANRPKDRIDYEELLIIKDNQQK
ncbi:MAG: hypothetical protein JXX14_10680 [Deltaproteobacteria bacterium]|nr:hypothetical protein [Deltaproteobacteria bacterium]